MKKLILLLLSLMTFGSFAADSQDKKMKWWDDAKFGMFIHWGLYSQCEGYWKEKPVSGIGEWILKIGEIPVADYKELTKTFNAEKVDVESWIKLAKQAGMKYVVITAKHHDGFALFDSKANDFNVVKATPYGQDIIKQFVEACNKHDLKVGFYYSQYQDWTFPGAAGNNWEPGYKLQGDSFEKYMREKALPQVKELLTQYGKIDMIWYDTPMKMTKAQSAAFLNLSRELQPDIIVSGRIGNELGDYTQMEDNNLPSIRQDYRWEVPVTMNHTWAYKRDDHHWKSTAYILWQLTQSVSMGGNYLLNIGPKGNGSVPQASVERLTQVGEWMKIHREVIQDASSSPYKNKFSWGNITQRPGRLYLNVMDWPKEQLALFGLKNKINKISLLKDGTELSFSIDGDYLLIDTPDQAPDAFMSVIAIDYEGTIEVDDSLAQEYKSSISLEAASAKNTTNSRIHFGATNRLFKPGGKLSWDFKITHPGKYKLQVITTGYKRMAWPEKPAIWEGDHEVLIDFNQQKFKAKLKKDSEEAAPRDMYNTFKVSEMGEVDITKAGDFVLDIKPLKVINKKRAGLNIRQVRLVPVN